MAILLEVSNISKSTFYFGLNKLKRKDKYKELKELICEIFIENKGRYGYRRITLELRNRNTIVNHKTVFRLMKECNLKCKTVGKNKYNSYKGKVGKVAKNILNRNFKADKPKEKLVTDITEFKVNGEKVYLSPVLDLYNGEIISYAISLRPTFEQVKNMLKMLFKVIPKDKNVILHSDQGWQYQMGYYQNKLNEQGIIQSMSRKGNCLDNSVMENFFGILKKEMYYNKKFKTTEELIIEIEEYIDYYNNKRIKSKLKGLSPVQYRIKSQLIA